MSNPDDKGRESASLAQGEPRVLPEPAKRALAEAEERRRARLALEQAQAKEIGGRDGPDPVRFGDWEKDGLTSDF